MDIAPELLEILACPKCKGKVHFLPEKNGFACHFCALLYQIEDGIPNFLPEEAKSLMQDEVD
ncbi:MAG: Trm112 family protein [Deltaproteobacteria bacterium]|nr:Trm112 family protein [Deltaproteobacteria bacterium]